MYNKFPRLKIAESLLLIPALFMAFGFELFGEAFGKIGLALHLPEALGAIPNFQPKLFPMEIFLGWVLLISAAYLRKTKFQLTRKNYLFFILVFFFAWGMLRLLIDLKGNPILAIRNGAFVWYLFLPLMVAFYPVRIFLWENFFKFFYTVVYLNFLVRFAQSINGAQLEKLFWCVDIGLCLALAYGYCGKRTSLAKFNLTTIGFAIGISYFGKFQRTSLMGLIVTALLLVASQRFEFSKANRPQWHRTSWAFLGILIGFSVGMGISGMNYGGPGGLFSKGWYAATHTQPLNKYEANGPKMEKFRLHLWGDAWQKFVSAPFLGIGFQEKVVDRIYIGDGRYIPNNGSFEKVGTPPISGPHNSYLNAITRVGFLGILLLVLHLLSFQALAKNGLYACAFVLLGQFLYAFFNVGLEGPIQSFPILLLVGVAVRTCSENAQKIDSAT